MANPFAWWLSQHSSQIAFDSNSAGARMSIYWAKSDSFLAFLTVVGFKSHSKSSKENFPMKTWKRRPEEN